MRVEYANIEVLAHSPSEISTNFSHSNFLKFSEHYVKSWKTHKHTMMYEATLKDRALFWRIEGQSLVLNKNVKKCFLKIDQSKLFFLSSLPKKYKPRCAFCNLDFS